MSPATTSSLDRTLLVRPPTVAAMETAGSTTVLLSNATLAPGAERRLWPGLDVSRWDRTIYVSLFGMNDSVGGVRDDA